MTLQHAPSTRAPRRPRTAMLLAALLAPFGLVVTLLTPLALAPLALTSLGSGAGRPATAPGTASAPLPLRTAPAGRSTGRATGHERGARSLRGAVASALSTTWSHRGPASAGSPDEAPEPAGKQQQLPHLALPPHIAAPAPPVAGAVLRRPAGQVPAGRLAVPAHGRSPPVNASPSGSPLLGAGPQTRPLT